LQGLRKSVTIVVAVVRTARIGSTQSDTLGGYLGGGDSLSAAALVADTPKYNPPWWRFLVAFVSPTLVFLSLTLDGAYSFTALVTVFGLIPILEMALKGSDSNLNEAASKAAASNRAYSWLIYSMVPLQYAFLALYFWTLANVELTALELVGKTLGMGIGCGVMGINVGHELGHRREAFPQFLAKVALLSSLYMHFFIEHNRGHHSTVATKEDPASAPKGIDLFRFLAGSIVGSYTSAWRLEAKRLRRRDERFWGLHNEMIRFQLIQVAAVLLVGVVFSWMSALGFLSAGFLGILLLETVNYIEHYGLRRSMKDNGRYEQVQPVHSWNSNHSLGRLLLFELSRHSDHHANPTRPYQLLRHFNESPQLPAGYPAMMVLSWFPPLWFRVMDPHIERWQEAT
jgi:alkane 1-monooxygenase